jgi:hypothetical protein
VSQYLCLPFQLFINDNCRKRSKRIAFYAIDCKDSCGEIFVDLQKHSYVQVGSKFLLQICKVIFFILVMCVTFRSQSE